MASLIFDEVASFAHMKPTHLKSISVVVHERSMVNDFVSAVEEAERHEGHPVKKFFGKLKGMNQTPAIELLMNFICYLVCDVMSENQRFQNFKLEVTLAHYWLSILCVFVYFLSVFDFMLCICIILIMLSFDVIKDDDDYVLS